ncbi:C-type lectin domain family 4 member E-like [Styela clava]
MDKRKLLALAVVLIIIGIVVILIETLTTDDSNGVETSEVTTITNTTKSTTNTTNPPPPPITTTKSLEEVWHNFSTGSYKLFLTNINFEAAKKSCRDVNARLVTEGIRNEVTRKSIIKEMLNPALIANKLEEGRGVWIGLKDMAEISAWKWIDGIASTRANTPWAPLTRNNLLFMDSCGMLRRYRMLDWYVNKQICAFTKAYVCEIVKSK